MPGAPADLVQQHIEHVAVGSFDQCCATVLRAVQAVTDGSQARAKGSYILNSDCSNSGGYHRIALHYEVAVEPPAPGAGLVCPSVASGGAVGTAGPSSGAAISALAGRPPFDAGPSVPELAPALATLVHPRRRRRVSQRQQRTTSTGRGMTACCGAPCGCKPEARAGRRGGAGEGGRGHGAQHNLGGVHRPGAGDECAEAAGRGGHGRGSAPGVEECGFAFDCEGVTSSSVFLPRAITESAACKNGRAGWGLGVSFGRSSGNSRVTGSAERAESDGRHALTYSVDHTHRV